MGISGSTISNMLVIPGDLNASSNEINGYLNYGAENDGDQNVKTQVLAGYTREDLAAMGYTVISQDDKSYTAIGPTGVVGNYLKSDGSAEWQPGSYSSMYTATQASQLFQNVSTVTDYTTIFLTDIRAGQLFGQFGRPSLGEARLASEALGRISKTVGGGALLLGTVVDGIQMYRYQNGYRDEYAISPAKAGANLAVGAIGYFGGVPGAIFAGIYTITDGFYIDAPVYPIFNNQFPINDNMYVAPPASLNPYTFSNFKPDVIGPPTQ